MKRGRRVDWFVLGVNCISFAILLGLGVNIGFVVHTLVSPVFPDVPWLGGIVAVITGAAIGMGSYGLYLKTEQAYKSIRAYAEHYGEIWVLRLFALIGLNVAMIAIDICGLLYRMQYLSSHGAGYLVVIGVGLALFPVMASLVLHPMVEKPASLVESERVNSFQRTHVDEVYQTLLEAPLSARHKAFTGDIDAALDEAVETREREHADKVARRTGGDGSLMKRAAGGVRTSWRRPGLPPAPHEDEEDDVLDVDVEDVVQPFRKTQRR